MDALYAPWRSSYIPKDGEQKKKEGCPFCIARDSHDYEDLFILRKTESIIVMLNKYPYNGGHILVVPTKHVPSLNALTLEERSALMEETSHAVSVVQNVLNAHGVNVGLNVGNACGGSIPDHLHMHVLPRWSGDTGFLPVFANTKVVSINLSEEYHRLRPHFSRGEASE